MIRFVNLIAAIRAHYQGPEDWLVGAEYAHAQEGALNRIVTYPVSGQASEPDVAAQMWVLSNIAPTVDPVDGTSRDDLVMMRAVNVSFEVWAHNGDEAESRLHALIIAIDTVCNALAPMQEDWPQASGNITAGGCMVILTAQLRLYVIASDATVIREIDPTEIGAGVDQSPVEPLQINAYQNEELIASYESEIET